MRGEFEPDAGPEATPEPPRRYWPLVAIGLILAWLLFSGGRVTDWFALRGPVPGTGGMVRKGYLVLLALILVIANFVLRMPREGGPMAAEEEGEDRVGEPAGDRPE
ncbi:hypothetical protein [Tautonia plasticadhaerens]|uniref:Uncharacterized protein n=1 Tax=Tautonia plasticadhaerens TaxID=2527974 RepID=A0A518HB41_9BACT|nr:hypothetical protein [Tautonia plasticadhaerens]QDV38041.1 hypothetical protein ElP_59890 [Tautonia plasticadhaerens]